jgi:hypothetical protein
MQNRPFYVLGLFIVILIGLPTRLLPEYMPPIMVQYAGDALWALAIFLLFGLLLPSAQTRTVFLLSVAVTWGIEFSELYQADWINALRAGWLGGLILGYTFIPLDLLLYLCGIGAGVGMEKVIMGRRESMLRP